MNDDRITPDAIAHHDAAQDSINAARDLHAHEELADPSELLTELAAAGMQGIIILGEQNIEFCNDRARELTGMPISMMAAGKPWMEFFAYQMKRGDYGEGEAAQQHFDRFVANFKARKVMQAELETEAGRIIRSDRVPNSLGGMTLTLTDITELKAREAELRAISIKAQAAEQAKSDFLANMSHELRTPLNGIMGMAEVLALSELDADQREAADVILSSTEALVAVVEDVLEVSRLDLGQVSMTLKPFDLSQLVRDLVAEFAAAAVAKGVNLRLRLPEDDVPMLIGDARLLRQSISQILDNAVRFTHSGQVDVRLDCIPDPAGRTGVTLGIQDTGVGIAPKDLLRVFDRFTQADSSNSRSHDGSGLGLSLAKSYVSLLGGTLEAESEVGVGSTFTIAAVFDAAPIENGTGPTSH